VSGAKRIVWQRERIVVSRLAGRALSKMMCDVGAGSSSVLRSAFDA
jgi:hypothetical protein